MRFFKKLVSIRSFVFLGIMLLGFATGLALSTIQTKWDAEGDHAGVLLAELNYLRGILLSLESGETRYARFAIAFLADDTLEKIASVDPQALNNDQRTYRLMVLKAYKNFRKTHPELYTFPSGSEKMPSLPYESMDDWTRRDRFISGFLQRFEGEE